MHLERLELSQFRSCEDTTAWFQPDLTVLVGENNGGKSNLVDAVRLLTTATDGRRTRYCEPSDLRFGSEDASFSVRAVYRGLTPAQQAMMLTASDGLETGGIAHRLRYDLPTGAQRRGRTTWTVGGNDAQDPEPAARDRIRHIYLPPLRDAQQALGSSAGERFEFVLRALAQGGEIEGVEEGAKAAFAALEAHSLVHRVDTAVATHLTGLTAGVIPQASKVGFVEPTLRQLARALRIKLADAGIDPVELTHSGLGYSNLLFLSTVIVELAATKDADLTIFLVEEPEAHLHPQLQTAVLDFLTEACKRDEGTPGSVQVIVTTHSAQLAASVPSEHIQVVRASPPEAAPAAQEPASQRSTHAVPIWQLAIEDEHRRKVNRYLDATKSAMLFGPRVVLVEGLAEMLLLPVLAKRLLADKSALARFRGTALVGIDGVDFEPYIRTLLSATGGHRASDRVVVITDTDPTAPGDRVGALHALGAELGAGARLVVRASAITLEASLVESGNTESIKTGFLAQRPNSEAAWDEYVGNVPAADKPAGVVRLLKDKRVLKGDLAQHLAAFVADADNQFTAPPYLAEAINAVSDP